MPVAVICPCGKQFLVQDELVGKRVKCPACQQVVTVPGTLVMNIPPEKSPKAAVEDDYPASDGREGKKSRPAPKSKTWLWIALAGGGFLVLLCGCCGIGIGAFVFLANRPDQIMLGKWQFDPEGTRQENPGKNIVGVGGMAIEFKYDGTLASTFGNRTETSTWKLVSRDGDTATLDVTQPNSTRTERMFVKALNRNQIRISFDRPNSPVIVYKRV